MCWTDDLLLKRKTVRSQREGSDKTSVPGSHIGTCRRLSIAVISTAVHLRPWAEILMGSFSVNTDASHLVTAAQRRFDAIRSRWYVADWEDCAEIWTGRRCVSLWQSHHVGPVVVSCFSWVFWADCSWFRSPVADFGDWFLDSPHASQGVTA